jgi:DNA-binding transcriptional LysR family regulator
VSWSDLNVVASGPSCCTRFLPKEHHWHRRSRSSSAHFAMTRWIVGAADEPSSIIVAACRRAGFEPQIAFTTDDALATQGLVAAGLAISLSSPWEASVLRNDVVLRPVTQPSPRRRIAAVIAATGACGAALTRLGTKLRTRVQPTAGCYCPVRRDHLVSPSTLVRSLAN